MPVVEYQKQGRIARITLNRPEALNAINSAVRRALRDAFMDFRQDKDLWVAIVTGAGDRAFSAGVDVKEVAQTTSDQQWDAFWGLEGYGAPETDLHYYKPVIAAINGYCLGIACTLALACDFRLAVPEAGFGFPEVKRGMPTVIGTLRLVRAIGLSNALPLLLTGDIIPAQEAWRIGLVHRIVPRERLLAEAEALAQSLLENAPLAVWATKEVAVRSTEMPFDHAWRLGESLRYIVNQSQDAREGPRAWVEKRKPVYTGR
ncbi:MAG: enoyl-CoA hydratase-related protein [Dehalococcoidia bacterium]|nr:enoyl-CoA hydratase-related protein [Dehalococcoidia bacterium]MDW8120105.1 enoyl-CoA hydratase-related protein [Chloroflexota bacterium]